MKVQALKLDDDLLPTTVTVEMTIQEAALFARMTGSLSPATVTTALGASWAEVNEEVYEGLAHGVFNRYWDDGVDGVIPRWPNFNDRLRGSE
jgi:hypothetical protein